ncbi:unnamed protein product [Ectocarpus sp. 6 AP-2014]
MFQTNSRRILRWRPQSKRTRHATRFRQRSAILSKIELEQITTKQHRALFLTYNSTESARLTKKQQNDHSDNDFSKTSLSGQGMRPVDSDNTPRHNGPISLANVNESNSGNLSRE